MCVQNVVLKLTWTQRIIEGKNNKIYSILENYLKYDIKLILMCNISAPNCNQCWKDNVPAFWKEIVIHWCNYNYLEPESAKEPGKEIIWLNSNVKVGNKFFLLKELCKKNMSINDLLTRQENIFATFTEFQAMHQARISFLNYYSLIHAISNRYKENLPTKLKKIPKCPQKVVKCIYDTHINEMKKIPEKTYHKWKIKLNIDMSKNDFLNLFNTMYSCTKSTY